MKIFAKPAYRDWAFWVALIWAVCTTIAMINGISTTKDPTSADYLTDVIAYLLVVGWGVIPARMRYKRYERENGL